MAARGLRAVGFLDLEGYLQRPQATERVQPLDVDELHDLLSRNAIEVVDVREKSERDHGYIPGSRNIPYRLIRACSGDFDGGRPVATICETGARAAVAASILAAAGIEARPVLEGGVPAWQARGNPTVQFRRCGN